MLIGSDFGHDDFKSFSVELNETFPWKTKDHRFGFHVVLFRRQMYHSFIETLIYGDLKFFHHPKYVMNAGRVMFHRVDELPFKTSQVFYAGYLNKTKFLVTPVITQLDDSLIASKPEE